MGADAIVVEPPGGAEARSYPPFRNDQPDPEQSLHWWHFYTSRRGITLDLASDAGAAAFLELIAGVDVLLTGADAVQLPAGLSPESPGRRQSAAGARATSPALAATANAAEEPVTDLTILAGAGRGLELRL